MTMITAGELFLNRAFDVFVGNGFRDSTIVAVLYPAQILVSQRLYDEIERAIKNDESLEFVRNLRITAVLQNLLFTRVPPTLNDIMKQSKANPFDWSKIGTTPN